MIFFGWILWHINHYRLFNANTLYPCQLDINNFVKLFVDNILKG